MLVCGVAPKSHTVTIVNIFHATAQSMMLKSYLLHVYAYTVKQFGQEGKGRRFKINLKFIHAVSLTKMKTWNQNFSKRNRKELGTTTFPVTLNSSHVTQIKRRNSHTEHETRTYATF